MMKKKKVKVELPLMYPPEKEFNVWVASGSFVCAVAILVLCSI